MILTAFPLCRGDVNPWLRYGAAGLEGYSRFLGYHPWVQTESKVEMRETETEKEVVETVADREGQEIRD